MKGHRHERFRQDQGCYLRQGARSAGSGADRRYDAIPGTAAPNPATAPGTSGGESFGRGGGGAAPVVDIENNLDSMPGADRLNWRTSIVDLMKLLGIDSDYDSRKALAEEMGRTDYSGSAEDNVWLHKQVMEGLRTHGGNVPSSIHRLMPEV